ncbi:MAG: endonuclease V [Deltaproteobacteria bacterium]|nr:endonuclease V [Deltaproteobacteria bacterium]
MTPREAIALQRRLAERVSHEPPRRPPRTVVGLDVSVRRGETTCRAGAVLMTVEPLAVVARVRVERPLSFPYLPGLLSFRELPVLLEALARLPEQPEALVLDGHGLAHPRRFGLACHLGVWGDLPALGAAKSILCGEHGVLGRARGATAPLVHRGEMVGVALRTRAGVKPIYVSIGHRLDLPGAVELALQLAPRYRLLEPIRQAHRLVNEPEDGGDGEGNEGAGCGGRARPRG